MPIWRVLTRHFFASLFDFGFLTDAGAESFKRLLMGAAAVALAIGLLLLRVFAAKYISLGTGASPEYLRSLLADHAFLMALPMWIVATMVVLVGHSLFPDESDFRILMAQPLTRGVVFGSKLAALLLYLALFVGTSHVALLPLAGLTVFSAQSGASFVPQLVAFFVSSITASVFAAGTMVALHGLIVLAAPRARLLAFATLVRSVLLSGLVLLLPLMLRLPGAERAFETQAPWLRLAPPAWFVSLERWMLGDSVHAPHVDLALLSTLTVFGVAALAYSILYTRFDRVTVRPAGRIAADRQHGVFTFGAARPVRLAVSTFTALTLRRSLLHQGIIVALTAAAAGFVVNDLYVQLTRPSGRRTLEIARWSLVWAPFALMLIASVAVRLSLAVPMEVRANWIFRMTEDPATRADAIGAAVRTVFRVGVIVPVLAAAPAEVYVLGGRAWIAISVELAAGWLLVELLMRHWRRLPFTCAYVPGKGFVPQMLVRGLFAFTAFTTSGAALAYGSLAAPRVHLLAVTVTLLPAVWLCIRRRRASTVTPLAFEDELPSEVSPLRLNTD
jgi:hypothetical protein